MAAEMSTGVLCMGAVYRRVPSFSMLVVRNQSVFHKKATGKIFFTCKDGEAIDKAIEQAILSGQSQVVTCYSCARNQLEETVAEFYFTWSFKQKK